MKIDLKIIKNDADYSQALARVEELVDLDPADSTPEAEELELLSLLINTYEDEMYPVDMPDPVDAIKFRMEQQGLKYKDMVPFFGSKSRVSEVLNRKRGLTLSMIRALHRDLGIPAEVLITDPKKDLPEEIEGVEWIRFPLAEMNKRGWIDFSGSVMAAKERSEEIIRLFFERAQLDMQASPVLFRKSFRSDKSVDEYALTAWYAKALIEQEEVRTETGYDASVVDDDFFSELKRLSFFNEGPLLVREFLSKLGIKLVIVPHLEGTYLDGASFFNYEGIPIIALTLRYDRVDNFWFTLFHELSHLKLHLKDKNDLFFDDLKSTKNLSKIEQEADRFGEEALIPRKAWKAFYSLYITEEDVKQFAQKLRISPAIVAGRIQKERNNFGVFRSLLGQGKVRGLFGM